MIYDLNKPKGSYELDEPLMLLLKVKTIYLLDTISVHHDTQTNEPAPQPINALGNQISLIYFANWGLNACTSTTPKLE